MGRPKKKETLKVTKAPKATKKPIKKEKTVQATSSKRVSPNLSLTKTQQKLKKQNEDLQKRLLEQEREKKKAANAFIAEKIKESRKHLEDAQNPSDELSIFGSSNDTSGNLFGDSASSTDLDDQFNEIEAGELDVFTYSSLVLSKIGDFPRFEIFRDGEQVGTRQGKYSWELLQQDYGGGDFVVKAKSRLTGRYVKQEARPIAGHRKDLNRPDPSSDTAPGWLSSVLEKITPQQPQQQALGIQDIMLLMAQMNPKNDNSAAIIAKAQTEAQTQFMSTVLNITQQQNTQQQTMTLELQKNMNTIISQMNDKFEKMFEKLTNKKEEITPLELFDRMEKAAQRGIDSYKAMQDMAKELAEEMKGDEPEGEDKSITGTLAKVLLPLMQNAQNNQAIQQQQLIAHQHQQALMAAQASPQRPPQQRPPQHVMGGPNTQPVESRPQQPPQSQNGAGAGNGARPKVKDLGMPVNFSEKTAEKVSVVENGKPEVVPVLKAKIFDTAITEIVEELIKDAPKGRDAAKRVLKKLNDEKLTSKDFLEHWTLEGIIRASKELGAYAVAEGQGRKEEFEKFLGEFYAYIQSKATKADSVRGEPNPAGENRQTI